MLTYTHKTQRRFHAYRYGLKHLGKHLRGERHGHRRRRATDETRVRRRRIKVGVGIGVFVLFVVAAGLAVSAWYSLTSARSSLTAARSAITAIENNQHALLTARGRAAAARSITQISADAAKADQTLRSSPGLTVLGALPILDTQRQGLIDLASDAQQTATAGHGLLQHVNTLVAGSHGTTVSIPQLESLRTAVQAARVKLETFNRPSGGLWGSLGDARAQFDKADVTLTTQLGRGYQILSYALPFVGADGPRTYLLAAENNAEMRDQGAVLSVAVVHADNGQITVSDSQSVDNKPLVLTSPVNYAMPPGMQQVFGAYQPTQVWSAVDATAGFPWSGGDLQAMYAQATGQHVDGVLAMDVPTVASLVNLTGPLTVPGVSGTLTGGNLAEVLLHQFYAGFAPNDQSARHDELGAVAKGVVNKLSSENVDLAQIADALSHDVAGRHLIVWDDVPSYQATVTKFGASGATDASDPTRTFHVAVENASATKLDYYITTAISQKIQLRSDNSAVVDTTVTLDNHVPAGSKPSFQIGPDRIHSFTAGQYVGNVYLWAPLTSSGGAGILESGLRVTPTSTSVLPQQHSSVSFQSIIPDAVRNGKLTLSYIPQPRLTPETVSVSLQPQGWHLTSPSAQKATLTKTIQLSWDLARNSG